MLPQVLPLPLQACQAHWRPIRQCCASCWGWGAWLLRAHGGHACRKPRASVYVTLCVYSDNLLLCEPMRTCSSHTTHTHLSCFHAHAHHERQPSHSTRRWYTELNGVGLETVARRPGSKRLLIISLRPVVTSLYTPFLMGYTAYTGTVLKD